MLTLDEQAKPPFSAEEIRILGCLMEKQLTTPNNYPLTMNSLMLACNQKTSREPLMNMKEGDVGHITRSLVEFGWVVIQNSGRAQRVEHKVRQKLKLTQQQQAILSVLMLRLPQTLNEIKVRTERMADFAGTEEIQQILDNWLTAENPLVVCLPPAAGRRESRYYHTLGSEDLQQLQQVAAASSTSSSRSPGNSNDNNACCEELRERIEKLEERLAELEGLLS